MYDELDRIERLYGSVAEYNRVQAEEEGEHYEPSDAEIRESEISHGIYCRKIQLLNGTPSAFAVNMKELWECEAPKRKDFEEYNDYVRASHDFGHDRAIDLIDKLSQYHGIDMSDRGFYETAPGTFAVSIEYVEHSMYQHRCASNLSYTKFKDVFRDFVEVGLWPTMCYKDAKERNHIYSNSSLGNLRISDLKWLGLETDEGLQKELAELGFDETKCREEVAKEYDAKCKT